MLKKIMLLLLTAGLVVRAAEVRKPATAQSSRNHIVRVVTVSQQDLNRSSSK